MKIGTIVQTKVGAGNITRINTTTYSIPLYHVTITEGKYTGEKITTPTVWAKSEEKEAAK